VFVLFFSPSVVHKKYPRQTALSAQGITLQRSRVTLLYEATGRQNNPFRKKGQTPPLIWQNHEQEGGLLPPKGQGKSDHSQ